MDHPEAHERIADLALEPAQMSRLDASLELDPLNVHLAGCAECRADLAGWQSTIEALDAAVAAGDGAPGALASLGTEQPIVAPDGLRTAVAHIPARLAEPRDAESDEGRVRRTGRRSIVGWRRVTALLAVLAVLVAGGAIEWDRARGLDAARSEAHALEGVTAVLDRLLADPGHHEVALTGSDGSPGGTLAWSSRDLVVLTTALPAPPSGMVYRCWVEQGGARSPVGEMWLVGDVAYWTGSLEGWATISLDQGGRFGVSLEPEAGGTGGTPVLVANLPG